MLRESSVHIGVCGKSGNVSIQEDNMWECVCVIDLYKLKWVYGKCVCI